jgi:hypothetical protein
MTPAHPASATSNRPAGIAVQTVLIGLAVLGLAVILAGVLVTRRENRQADGGDRLIATPTPRTDDSVNPTVAASGSYQKFVSSAGALSRAAAAFDPQDTRHSPPEVETELGF